MRHLISALALAGALQVSPALATPAMAQSTAVAAPAPTQDDDAGLTTLDGLLDALYDTVSGDAGPRDWDRFRSLFYPGATLVPSGRRADGTLTARVLTPDGYITQNGPVFAQNGFFEREIGRSVREYGPTAQISSSYEARRAESDAEPFMRGVNAIQAFNDGKRWWVISIAWAAETPEWPVPADLLKPEG